MFEGRLSIPRLNDNYSVGKNVDGAVGRHVAVERGATKVGSSFNS